MTRTALITGAGSGMGLETARLLARDGIAVVLVGRRQEPLDKAAAEIGAEGGTALALAADITRADDVTRVLDRIHAELGPVDVLVNNAGSASSVLNPQWLPHEEWRQVLDVNLTAVFQLTQAVLPDMLGRDGGTIVTVSSLAAVNPNLLGGAAYGAAKAGVRNFMTFLHNTFRNQGLRAITVLPGEADTPILDNRARPPAPEERAHMLQPEDVAEAVRLAIMLPQRVVLQEIVVAPTRQRDTSADLEISRWTGAPADAGPGKRSGDADPRTRSGDAASRVHPADASRQVDPADAAPRLHSTAAPPRVNPVGASPRIRPADALAQGRPAGTSPEAHPTDTAPQVASADAPPRIHPADASPRIRPTDTVPQVRPADTASPAPPADADPQV